MNRQSHIFMIIAFFLSFLFIFTLIGEGIYKMKKKEGGVMLFLVGIFLLITVSMLFAYLMFIGSKSISSNYDF